MGWRPNQGTSRGQLSLVASASSVNRRTSDSTPSSPHAAS